MNHNICVNVVDPRLITLTPGIFKDARDDTVI